MSGSVSVAGDLVPPGRMVLDHRTVDDIDQVTLKYASSTTSAFGGLVAGQQFSCARMEPFLHDGRCIQHAVQAPVSASVMSPISATRTRNSGTHSSMRWRWRHGWLCM
jgi:hypothetical protein